MRDRISRMSEEKQSFWERLFSGSSREVQNGKVLQYVIHRLKGGAKLEDVIEEEYVHRNLSQSEIDEIISDPELVHAAREQLGQAFESDELRLDLPPR
jgi:hypothetical protein